MIEYDVSLPVVIFTRYVLKLPNFRIACVVALAPAIFCGTMNGILLAINNTTVSSFFQVDSNVYSAITALLSFLLAFRTSVAYQRFWEGCNILEALKCSWFSAASLLASFSSYSDCDQDLIVRFQQRLIRLVSLMNAVIIADLDHGCNNKERWSSWVIDPASIDRESLMNLATAESKPKIVYMWIQNLVVEAMKNRALSIPPPLLGCTFGELKAGLGHFHSAKKLSTLPCPFPYVAMVEMLLIMHTVFTPIVLAELIEMPLAACTFVWLIEFFMWSTYLVSKELENPFGRGINTLNMVAVQTDLNMDLLTLVRPIASHMPELHVDPEEALKRAAASKDDRHSFVDIVGEPSLGCEAVVATALREGLFAAGGAAAQRLRSKGASAHGLNPSLAVQVGGQKREPNAPDETGWAEISEVPSEELTLDAQEPATFINLLQHSRNGWESFVLGEPSVPPQVVHA